MKTETQVKTKTIYEEYTVVCPRNPKHKLTAIFDECYLDINPCLRLVCYECADELVRYKEVCDFRLHGEPKEWSEFAKKIPETCKKRSGWD